MSENQVNQLLDTTMSKIKNMVDVDTIIGNPVVTSGGATIIPVSKVSYGFAGGGSDMPSKKADAPKDAFLGGSAAGITIQPVAFLVVTGENVRVLQIEPYTSTIDRAVDRAPDIIDKITALVQKEKEVKLPEDPTTK